VRSPTESAFDLLQFLIRQVQAAMGSGKLMLRPKQMFDSS
jgi:hypothetical protein